MPWQPYHHLVVINSHYSLMLWSVVILSMPIAMCHWHHSCRWGRPPRRTWTTTWPTARQGSRQAARCREAPTGVGHRPVAIPPSRAAIRRWLANCCGCLCWCSEMFWFVFFFGVFAGYPRSMHKKRMIPIWSTKWRLILMSKYISIYPIMVNDSWWLMMANDGESWSCAAPWGLMVGDNYVRTTGDDT